MAQGPPSLVVDMDPHLRDILGWTGTIYSETLATPQICRRTCLDISFSDLVALCPIRAWRKYNSCTDDMVRPTANGTLNQTRRSLGTKTVSLNQGFCHVSGSCGTV